MADPQDVANLSQLDLQNLPPEQAAALARAQQAALAKQQFLAQLQMQSVRPELQKAGELEYGQASRERAGGKEQSGNVLRYALEKLNQERQLKMLQQQINYQNAELGLQGERLNVEAFRPLIDPLLSAQERAEKIRALAAILPGALGKKLGDVLSLPAESQIKAINEVAGAAQRAKGGGVPVPGKRALPKSTAPAAAPVPADPWAAMRQKYSGVAKKE